MRLGPTTAPIVVAQTTTDSARARVCLGREVGGGVARAGVGRRGRAEQRGAGHQQQHRPDDAGDHRQHSPGTTDEVAGGEADPAALARHHPGEEVRRHRGAEDLCRLRQAGEALRAGQVAGEQRGGGDADRDAERPDGLGEHQDAHGPALDQHDVGAGRRGGHRSLGGSSRARQTAAHTCLGGTPASSASCGVRRPSSAITNCSAHDLVVAGAEVVLEPAPELGVPHVGRTSHRWWTTSCRW